jgi:hypothetical protein
MSDLDPFELRRTAYELLAIARLVAAGGDDSVTVSLDPEAADNMAIVSRRLLQLAETIAELDR